MREEFRRRSVRVRVGSTIVVAPEGDGVIEDRARGISVVQQSPVIINRSPDEWPREPGDQPERWI